MTCCKGLATVRAYRWNPHGLLHMEAAISRVSIICMSSIAVLSQDGCIKLTDGSLIMDAQHIN